MVKIIGRTAPSIVSFNLMLQFGVRWHFNNLRIADQAMNQKLFAF